MSVHKLSMISPIICDFTGEIAHNSGDLFQHSLVRLHVKFELSLISPIMYAFTNLYDFTGKSTLNLDHHLQDWLENQNLIGERTINW